MQSNHNDTTLTIFNAFEYERGLGQPNPVWESIPDHVYPLECKEIVYYSIAVLGTIGVVLGIFFALLQWAAFSSGGLSQFVLAWSIIFCIAFAICLVLLWLGGKDRRRQQKELIEQTSRKQQEMVKNKK